MSTDVVDKVDADTARPVVVEVTVEAEGAEMPLEFLA